MSKLAFLVAATFFMEFLDATILTTALPAMAQSMGAAAVDLDVGVSIYSLTLAVFILPGAWLVERFGARPVFTSAIVIFTLSSIACGFSQGPISFDIARAVQGVGGALMVPVGRLLVLRVTPKSEVMRAVAILTWPGLTAPLIGPPLGGYLADAISWRAIFFVNIPLGIIGALLALRWTPRLEPQPRRPFDVLGFLLAGGALGSALLGLDRFSGGHADFAALGLAALCIACSVAMVFHVRLSAHPIVDGRPFAHATFARSVTGGTAARIVLNGVPFVLPLMFQLGMSWDATRAGLMLTPLFVGNIGIKPLTTAILRFGGFRRVLLVNGALQIATLIGCAFLSPTTPIYLIAALLVVSGASRSMHFTSVGTLPFSDVPPEEMSMANIIFSVTFQGSMAFGVGFAAAAIKLGTWIAPAPPLAAFHLAFLGLALLMFCAWLDHWRLASNAGAVLASTNKSNAKT